MHGAEKSDPRHTMRRTSNEAGHPAKEWVERRGGAAGNAREPHGGRTQDRETPLSGIERIRKVAKERKGERFTTLLHHIDVPLLEQAYIGRNGKRRLVLTE